MQGEIDTEGPFALAQAELLERQSDYRARFFKRRLGSSEIDSARNIISDLVSRATEISSAWLLRTRSQDFGMRVTSAVSSQLSDSEIRSTLGELLVVLREGTLLLKVLEAVVTYSDHFQRQCSYLLETGEDKTMREEDASEHQASAREAVRQVRDEINFTHSQLQLFTLCTQTFVTNQISKLTVYLVILTCVALVVAVPAAVFSGITLFR